MRSLLPAMWLWLAGAGAWLVTRWGWEPWSLGLFAAASLSLLAVSGSVTTPRGGTARLPVSVPYLLWGTTIVLVFLVFHYHSPEASFVPIFDTLDGTLPIFALLGTQPVFDGLGATLPQLLGGIPKNSAPTQLNLYPALFRFLAPAHAYVAMDAIVRIMGLAGMLLLLRRLLPRASDLAVAGAATAFALLPHLVAACLSVAGLPLLLFAVLEILREKGARWPWLVVGLFPFVSMLPLVGWVVLAVLGSVVLFDAVRRRRWPWRGAFVLGVLTLGYVAADYRLLYQLLFQPEYVSQRIEFGPYLSLSGDAAELGRSIVHHAFRGFPHAASLHAPVVLLAVALGLLGAFRRGRLDPEWRGLLACLAAIGCLSVLFGVSFHRPWQEWQLAADIGPFRTFHLSRVSWWEPVLWMVAFALALNVLAQHRVTRTAAVALAALQVAFVFFTNDFYERKEAQGIRIGEFTSTALFDEIREHIGRPVSEYRVASLGMPASIATYNGFYTADGYLGNYPLAYKHRFRRLIASELEKNRELERAFDLWGAQCHVVSAELALGWLRPPHFPGFTKDHARRRVRNLALDSAALTDLGIDYLFSAVEILSPERSGLRPVRVFERPDSPWEIHLYEPAAGWHRAGSGHAGSEPPHRDQLIESGGRDYARRIASISLHSRDAGSRGLEPGDLAELRSDAGSVVVPVIISDEMMPGVVSLPHGFGHDVPGTRLEVASTRQRGVNVNQITSDARIDEISGASVLNGVPVEITRAR